MKAQLLVVQGRPHGWRRTFPPGEFVFGRGPGCHVPLNSPLVSRQHCLLCVEQDSVSIRDLASTNGTLVNGTRLLAERLLEDGDRVQIGQLVFQLRVLPGDDPSPSDALLATPPDAMQQTQIIPPGLVPDQGEPASLPDPLEPTALAAPALPPELTESAPGERAGADPQATQA
ncbi:MAG: FHA domain-containing protein [Gemmataceae bacterium]|nr:FHA domain-containing protein [Gemmataceae bacterium]